MMRAPVCLASLGLALSACFVGSESTTDEVDTTVQGTIELVVIDHNGDPTDGLEENENPDELVEEYVVYLNSDDGKVRQLELEDGTDPTTFDTGDRVVVTGKLGNDDRTIRCGTRDDVEILERPLVLAAAGLNTTRKLAVILFNFSNDTSQPLTADYAKERLFTGETSANAFFKEGSYNQLKLAGSADVTGDVFGWYTIADQSDDCDTAKWRQLATQAATNAGKNLSGYNHLMFVFPANTACTWAGLGAISGSWTLVKSNAMSQRVPAHEIGHNLGLSHSSSITCTDASGGRVALSNTCTTSEYGDTYDTMGSPYRHFNGYQKARLGWFASSNIKALTSTAGTYTVDLAPLGTTTTAAQVLKIPRPKYNDFYYVEYRQPTPIFDNFTETHAGVNGLLLHLSSDPATRTASKLLDMNPATTTFSDAPLELGATHADLDSSISIQFVSRTPTSARVKVIVGAGVVAPPADTTAPTVTVTGPAAGAIVAGTVALSATATDNLAVTKVVFYSNTTVVGTDMMPPYSAVWNSAAVTSGSRTITAKAYDAAGNVTTSAAITITVDNAVPAPELVTNGGFEEVLTPWTKTGNAYHTTASANSHTGTGYAYLGAAQSAAGTLTQEIAIPSGATRSLAFWLNVTTNETTTISTYDRLYVEVRGTDGTLLKTLGTFGNRDATFLGDYHQHFFSLAEFAGQTVVLQFRVTTNTTNTTWFRLDDVTTL